MDKKILVLTWEYIDKSAHGIVKAFNEEGKAKEMRDLLIEHSISKNFFINEVKYDDVFDE